MNKVSIYENAKLMFLALVAAIAFVHLGKAVSASFSWKGDGFGEKLLVGGLAAALLYGSHLFFHALEDRNRDEAENQSEGTGHNGD